MARKHNSSSKSGTSVKAGGAGKLIGLEALAEVKRVILAPDPVAAPKPKVKPVFVSLDDYATLFENQGLHDRIMAKFQAK
jgi:hypothetical protein